MYDVESGDADDGSAHSGDVTLCTTQMALQVSVPLAHMNAPNASFVLSARWCFVTFYSTGRVYLHC